MDLIRDLAFRHNIICLVNLHQIDVAMKCANRIIGLRKGQIVFDGKPADLHTDVIENIYDHRIEELMLGGELAHA